MELKATIELNEVQVLEMITKALLEEGISISHQDIEFIIEEKQMHPMDHATFPAFTGVKIKNVKMNTRLERD